MPKSKAKRKKPAAPARPVAWGGAVKKRSDRLWNYGLAGVAALALVIGVVWWWQSHRAEQAFLTLAAAGEPALERVERIPSKGRAHLEPGQSYFYESEFPTSGPHAPVPTEPGVYEEAQPKTQLVHALEHGNIVIYYDQPGEDVLDTLEHWAGLYDGDWSGIILVPAQRLGERIVLTAWTRRLELPSFEPEAAAAFIDAFRGRGPEHPVR